MPTDVFSEGVDLTLESPDTVRVQLQQVMETEPQSDDHIPVDLIGADLTPEQRQQVKAFLCNHKEVFYMSDHDYGQADAVCHQIPTGDASPVRECHRQIPPNLNQEAHSRTSRPDPEDEAEEQAVGRTGAADPPETEGGDPDLNTI
ncbi:hypothetical protein SKAU_G00287780 [Synaphobranchus kaupii]|uniref:Uncharacterized protein n=1 Tax=Synaphobranchus kaupii TaxID=118154 RepID=A0A9Q1IMI3_SYNKA|nr:hypothetical protein SKAU_G00287780 [Synaphobranchus kaupii]